MKRESGNLLAGLPARGVDEAFEALLSGGAFRLERIVSEGHASPPGFWYDQDEDEWVVLLAGAAEVLFEGEPLARRLNPGDYLLIPGGRRHCVTWTDPDRKSVWLALHYRAGAERGGF